MKQAKEAVPRSTGTAGSSITTPRIWTLRKIIRENLDTPIILFPGIPRVSSYVMHFLYRVFYSTITTGFGAETWCPLVKRPGYRTSHGLHIVEPGAQQDGWERPSLSRTSGYAVAYALAAEFWALRFFLEAEFDGQHWPAEMIAPLKVHQPHLFVGGE